jgi:hypothetical protein
MPDHRGDVKYPDTENTVRVGRRSSPRGPVHASLRTVAACLRWFEIQLLSLSGFYNQSNPARFNTSFAAIATDIGSGSSRLVADGF